MKKGLDDKRDLGRLQRMTYGRSAEYSFGVADDPLAAGSPARIVCMISGGKVSGSYGPTLVGFW